MRDDIRVINALSEQVIAAALEVHRALGPGLLESTYERCLAHEFALRGLNFEQQKELPLVYKGIRLEGSYRLDFIVADIIIIEVKSVDAILPVHEAQLLSYLRLVDRPLGLLINFHAPLLKNGIRRLINRPLAEVASRPA